MRRAVACLPAPASASRRTGTSLCESSRMTASTGCMLALTPSTKDRASSAGRFSQRPSPALGNCLPTFALLLFELIFAPDSLDTPHISTMIAEGHSQRPQILGVSHTTYFQ